MPTLKELIQKRIDRLESVPNTLLSSIDKQNELLFKAIIQELGTLETKDGNIVASTGNLAKISAILEKVKETLFGGDYVDAIKSFANEIQIQATLNNDILEKTVGSFEDSALYNATIKAAQRNTLMLLDESAVSHNLLQPIGEILTNSIVTGAGYLDAVETLRQNMVGEGALLNKYAGTYIKDAFAISDRQYAQLTSKEHGIVFFKYDGGEISDSRDFCIERKGSIFHIDEIKSWGRQENTDKGRFKFPAASPVYTNPDGIKIYWFGENYGTNEATIFSFCGGFGCVDVLISIATEYVPKIDIDRAIRLGYYK